jgi:DNA-binding transcriptional LysR family regulator
LFTRVGHRLIPTSEAQILFNEVSTIFDGVKAVERLVHELRENRYGHLVIAAGASLAHTILPAAVARFRMRYPTIGISIRCLAVPDVIDAVVRQEAHIGLTYNWSVDEAPINNKPDGLRSAWRRRVEIACVMRRDHSLTGKDVVTPVDLLGQQVMTYVEATPLGQLVVERMGHQHMSSLAPIQVSFGLTACHLARELAGVALIDPSMLVRPDFSDLTVRPFRPEIAAWFEVGIARSASFSRLAESFIGELRQMAPEYSFSDISDEALHRTHTIPSNAG